MKKIMTIVVALSVSMAVFAQKGRVIGGSRVYIVSPGLSYGYSPFYSPFGYYPFGYPYGYNNTYRGTSKLQAQIEDIKNDYKDRIWSAKHDKTISRAERKTTVHQLKSDRDKAVNDAKMNYHNAPRKQPTSEQPSTDPQKPVVNG